jgi:hypothetical protein
MSLPGGQTILVGPASLNTKQILLSSPCGSILMYKVGNRRCIIEIMILVSAVYFFSLYTGFFGSGCKDNTVWGGHHCPRQFYHNSTFSKCHFLLTADCKSYLKSWSLLVTLNYSATSSFTSASLLLATLLLQQGGCFISPSHASQCCFPCWNFSLETRTHSECGHIFIPHHWLSCVVDQ